MRIKGRKLLIAMGCALSFNALAGTMYTEPPKPMAPLLPWSVIGSLGYGEYGHMDVGQGQTPIGRFAIAKELFGFNLFSLGLEGGVQSGNNMRLDLTQAELDLMGGTVINTTVKPMLDLLLTAKTGAIWTSPVFAVVKGGIAYRRWIFDRDTISDKSQVAGEVQAGLGFPIHDVASLNLLYQGVFGRSPHFHISPGIEPGTGTGEAHYIPMENAVLLSLSVIV